MKKNVYSPIYIYMKMVLFLNILLLIIGASYLITQNDYLLDIIPNPDYRQMLFSVNGAVLIMGGFMVALNLILLLLVAVYSQQRYFRLMEKIDFENIHTSVSLLKNLKNFDESGRMGEKLKETLLIYLRFTALKKIRIELEQQKFHFLMNRMEEPALHLFQDENKNEVKIKFANQAALRLLSLETRSLIVGRSFEFLLDRESSEGFFNMISALDYEKNREISEKPFETSLNLLMNPAKSLMISELEKNAEKIKESPVYEEVLMDFYPFFMEIPDERRLSPDSGEEAGENMTLDSFLVILKHKKGFWKK